VVVVHPVAQSDQNTEMKISPVSDRRSTPLEWLSSICDLDLGSGHAAYHRASVINLCVDGLTAGTPQSSRSRDTKTKTNIKKGKGRVLI